jgi:nucleoside-diphosphate-sugar epimerase
MTNLVRAPAQAAVSEAIAPRDRVLVIGATGWFGRTASALLFESGAERLVVASRPRSFTVGGTTLSAIAWDSAAIEDFAPTIVIDCAFLTRDLIGEMSLESYVARNRQLTANLLSVASMESVHKVVTISSGAAVHPTDAILGTLDSNPYGFLKREAEESLSELGRARGIATVVARAWSVSGAFVQKPRSYALSDMIMQASQGAIAIRATNSVFRRYTAVEDLLAVSLLAARVPEFHTIEGGGQLVEMSELATLVRAIVNPEASVTRPALQSRDADRYYPPGEPWERACHDNNFTSGDLREQITTANAGFVSGEWPID